MAQEVLTCNDIAHDEFAQEVRTLSEKGRGNVEIFLLIKGPANCAKTFLLNPLNAVYKKFPNPVTTTFAGLGAENAKVIFLNDFRWCT